MKVCNLINKMSDFEDRGLKESFERCRCLLKLEENIELIPFSFDGSKILKSFMSKINNTIKIYLRKVKWKYKCMY